MYTIQQCIMGFTAATPLDRVFLRLFISLQHPVVLFLYFICFVFCVMNHASLASQQRVSLSSANRVHSAGSVMCGHSYITPEAAMHAGPAFRPPRQRRPRGLLHCSPAQISPNCVIRYLSGLLSIKAREDCYIKSQHIGFIMLHAAMCCSDLTASSPTNPHPHSQRYECH